MSNSDEPLLSMENVNVQFEAETALMEATPDRIKEWIGWQSAPVRAVNDVSLDVEENDIVAIVGESGSGKTTLGKTAVGLQKPSRGTIRYRGHDIWELKEKNRIGDTEYANVRKALQIVHQDPNEALNPFKTIMTSLRDPLKLWYPEMSNADCRERIFSLFRECGLTPVGEYENRYPHELSGGEQQRVTLIRSILLDPDLIMLDEPVSALDPSLSIELMDLLLELQEMFETSFLVISHNLAHARYITSQADGKIAIMYLGEIVEFGDVDEVLENPKHPYTKILKWAMLPTSPDKARDKLTTNLPVRRFESPDPANQPSGCQFHERCPKAREACVTQSPVLDTDEEHKVACHMSDPDHEYWETDFLDEEGEIEIPE